VALEFVQALEMHVTGGAIPPNLVLVFLLERAECVRTVDTFDDKDALAASHNVADLMPIRRAQVHHL
jgi:hypothetical protein